MESQNTHPTVEYNFTVVDYAVFIGMLCVSTLIGVYFAIKARKVKSNKEFLTANKSLGMFPVAMSLLASFQSSVTILGYPAEMFYRGTQFWMVVLSSLMASVIAAELFLPVFYKLGFTSVNKYLEDRFNSSIVRKAVSASFLLCTIPYMSVVLYGPSLALKTVTGMETELSIVLIGLVCTFYTSLGGIKAVVWTDVIQVFLMFAGLIVIMFRGFWLVGGVSNAFQIAAEHGRIKFFNFNFDLYSTTVIWNCVLGMGIMWSGNYATSQTEVSRYCNVSSQKRARASLYVNFVGVAALISCACLCGVALFAHYAHCDPLKSKLIDKTDQLMPHFVMTELNHWPGVAGLFVSCVFSASLSTMSSGFNALATVTYDDFLTQIPYFRSLKESKIQLMSKAIAFGYGLIAILLAFVVSQIDSILQAAISIAGAVVGPMFGLFLLGVLCPFANSIGVLSGLLCGEIFGFTLLIGSLIHKQPPEMLQTQTDKCPAQLSAYFTDPTMATSPAHMSHRLQREGAEKLFGIAYLLVPPICCFISLLIGSVVSLLSGGLRSTKTVNPLYLSDYAWYIWPKSLMPIRPLEQRGHFATTPTDFDHRFNSLNGSAHNVTHSNMDYPITEQYIERSIVDESKRARFRKQNAIDLGEHNDQDLKCLKYKLFSDDDRINSITPITTASSISTSSNSAV